MPMWCYVYIIHVHVCYLCSCCEGTDMIAKLLRMQSLSADEDELVTSVSTTISYVVYSSLDSTLHTNMHPLISFELCSYALKPT